MEKSIEHVGLIFDYARFKDDPDLRFSFVFQSEDKSIDTPSVSWERRRDFRNVCLTPDLYYTMSHGYGGVFPDAAPDWASREDKVFWRGGTSGVLGFDRESLRTLPRYQLCAAAKRLGEAADVRFYAVAQTANADEHEAVTEALRAADMLAGWVEIDDYARYRYIVQIGGNASSWGLVQKLRLGACIFFVEGEWTSWFERHIEPWVHYVPVRADLADFEEKFRWAQANPAEAERIARDARALGMSLSFEPTMAEAAEAIKSAFA